MPWFNRYFGHVNRVIWTNDMDACLLGALEAIPKDIPAFFIDVETFNCIRMITFSRNETVFFSFCK